LLDHLKRGRLLDKVLGCLKNNPRADSGLKGVRTLLVFRLSSERMIHTAAQDS
jgi:hypothetical protein